LPSDTVATVDALAGLGYLAIGVAYRNVGDGAPIAGSLRPRDEDLRDTRAVLAAAQWAATEHGRGSPQVAFVGSSMGTWPAFWAISDRADVADLQLGLDLRTAILVAETANHLRNAGDDTSYLPLVSTDPAERAQGIVGGAGTIALAGLVATATPAIGATDLESGAYGGFVAEHLTPRGRVLVRRLLIDPADPAIAGCADLAGMAPVCAESCIGATFLDELDGVPDPGPVTDWIVQPAIDALGYWRTTPIDPGPGHPDSLIAALRDGSPTFAATGLVAGRALSLLSINDPHYDAAAHQLVVDALRDLGAAVPDPPTIDRDDDGPCGHDDYTDPARGCGFDAIASELATAFE
jgi:hypothetical protein